MKIFHEVHSDEVQEIISAPPHWLVQWGITIALGLIALIVFFTWFIKYPDVISTPFILTANNPPRKIISRQEGRIEKLLVIDGQFVEKGQTVAYLESTADHKSVVELLETIRELSIIVKNNQWAQVESYSMKEYTRLGEIQSDFQMFSQQLRTLKSFLNNGFYEKKRTMLAKDYYQLKQLESNLNEQIELQKKEYEIAEEEFKIHEVLYRDKVISSLDFKREKAKLLSKELPLKTLRSSTFENKILQTAKQKELLELDNAVHDNKNSFVQSLQTMKAAIESWFQRYLLVAPVKGQIYFSAPLQDQQHFTSGEDLLTVSPSTSSYEGYIKLPQANFGKLAKGQKVLIKLDGYPYREYGILEGTLQRFSLSPGQDNTYWGVVILPNGLKTVYGYNLRYRNGLKGTSEIITRDQRLLERFVTQLRDGKKINYKSILSN